LGQFNIIYMDSDSKAAAVLKGFCFWFLDELFLEGKLPVLSIPKRVCNIDSLEQACSLRKLNCAESARQYAEILAVAAVVTETVLCPGNKYMSQRDVYYSLKHQFTSQTLCNTRIIELGLLWELKRCRCAIWGLVP
jgi:DNA topoisomerase VI subunit A